MRIRKLSLEEWFLYYQLRHIDREHCHLPAWIEVNIRHLFQHYQGHTLPISFILIKALALTLKQDPAFNRQFVHSLWGPRLIESDAGHINLPVLIREQGQNYLTAMVLKDADQKTVWQIQNEVRQFRKQRVQDLPVGKYIFKRPNHFLNRLRLRVIYQLVSHVPQLQVKFGAGMASVSSLLNTDHQGTTVCIVGRGPGAISLTACQFNPDTGQMYLSLAFDHYALSGIQMIQASQTLTRILENKLLPGSLLEHLTESDV